ncbi:MAG: PIN domain-containing protein [Candidatus Woesearchaeota archaeon]
MDLKRKEKINPEKYYADASIWIDIYEDRKGYNNELFGDYALKFFPILKAQGKTLVITDILLKELESFYSLEEIKGMIKPFEKIIARIISTKSQREEARSIAKERQIPPGDVLHAILARANKLILITRDNHFRKLADLAEHYLPEELI